MDSTFDDPNHNEIQDPYLINKELYDQNIASFIYIRYGYFKQICTHINIKLDYDIFDKFAETNSDIIKCKIDCFNDYVILLKTDDNIVCIGQNNILNICELMPCHILNMRIHFNSFGKFFDDIKFNPNCSTIITNEYIDHFKQKVKNIIEYILSKLNYSNTHYSTMNTLKQVKNYFPYDDLIYPNCEVPHFSIDSEEEKLYWIDLIKKYLAQIQEISGPINKMDKVKHVYNIIHKYIHLTIKHINLLITLYNKINQLFYDIYHEIYKNIILIQNSESNNEIISECYYKIKICVFALNSIQRVQMLITDREQTKIVYKLNKN
jgi:hypothetical protein